MRYLATMALCITLALNATAGYAQSPVRQRFMPARPTLSPYLGLTVPSFGGVPSYFTQVRPVIRQQQINQIQQDEIFQQQRTLQQLEAGIQIQQSGAAPTGVRSSYMNFSHFYPAKSR